jgi:hypothetical protein
MKFAILQCAQCLGLPWQKKNSCRGATQNAVAWNVGLCTVHSTKMNDITKDCEECYKAYRVWRKKHGKPLDQAFDEQKVLRDLYTVIPDEKLYEAIAEHNFKRIVMPYGLVACLQHSGQVRNLLNKVLQPYGWSAKPNYYAPGRYPV